MKINNPDVAARELDIADLRARAHEQARQPAGTVYALLAIEARLCQVAILLDQSEAAGRRRDPPSFQST